MMKKFEAFQDKLENILGPFSAKISANKTISAISSAMLTLMPVMIGGAIFSLLSNFPVTQVTDLLTTIGLKPVLDMFVATSTNLTPLFLSFMVAHNYTKSQNYNGPTGGIFALLIYFTLIPSSITIGETVVNGYSSEFLGGNGIFVAMIFSVITAKIYVLFMKKKWILKMPKSVPPMIAQSFEAIYAGIVIVGLGIATNYLIQGLSFNSVFDVVSKFIQQPIMLLGANVPALILLYTLINLCWFFGIHPSAITSFYMPVLIQILSGNATAFVEGKPLPYMNEALVYMFSGIGGASGTLGLVLSMIIFSKSKRYKTMTKLCGIPGFFNINEPLIFGMPMIMNPIFFIPMIASSIVTMGTVSVFSNFITLNPIAATSMPWTMPFPITAFFGGGIPLLLVALLAIILVTLLYAPFFIALDRKELQLEQEEVAN